MEGTPNLISPNFCVGIDRAQFYQKNCFDENAFYEKTLELLQSFDLQRCTSTTLYLNLKELKNQIVSLAHPNSELFRIFQKVINKNENIPHKHFISNRWTPRIIEKANYDQILPNEILQYVLRILLKNSTSWTTVGAFACTSKAFYMAANDPIILKELLDRGVSEYINIDTNLIIDRLSELSYFFKGLSINIIDPSEICKKNLDNLFSSPNYKTFQLGDMYGEEPFITDNNILQLAQSSQNIQNLVLHGADLLTNKSLLYIALYCKELRSLKISNCQKSQFTPQMLSILITCCKKLKSLGLYFIENEKPILSSPFIKKIPVAGKDCLSPFAEAECQSYDPWLDFISRSELTFKEFELGNAAISDEFLSKFIHASSSILKKIKIERTQDLTIKGLLSLKECKVLRHFEMLDFKAKLKDESLNILTNGWSELKTCAIHEASELTALGIESLIQHCPKLEKLTLDSYIINNETFEALFSKKFRLSLKGIYFGSLCKVVKMKVSEIIDQLCENKELLPKLKAFHLYAEVGHICIVQLNKLAQTFPSFEFVWPQSGLPEEEELVKFQMDHADFFIMDS